MYQTALDTPVGRLLIEGTRDAVTAVRWVALDVPVGKGTRVLIQARKQLREYFKGKRQTFDVALDVSHATHFQRSVWLLVSQVGYGETITYAEIARRLRGTLKGSATSRAVGQANARNPLSIIIPCHRVLSSNGKLTGYAGGIRAKEWLLRHEKAVLV
jgi:methylated-DNA-[protein]-cysteine S-methyltransferase